MPKETTKELIQKESYVNWNKNISYFDDWIDLAFNRIKFP